VDPAYPPTNLGIFCDSLKLSHPKQPVGKMFRFLGIVLPAILSILLMGYGFYSVENRPRPVGVLQGTMLALYLLFVLLLMVCGLALFELTNEPSISGMVAQRFNPVGYMCILTITGISFFTSCFILSSAIASTLVNHYDGYMAADILAALSPIISCLILVFPLVVTKTPAELGMTPRGMPHTVDEANNPVQFKMRFYKGLSPKCHEYLHFAVVLIGVFSGLISSGLQLYAVYHIWWWGSVVLVTIAALCLFLFLVTSTVGRDGVGLLGHNRASLLLEFLGLYFYMLFLIHTSAITGDLLNLRPLVLIPQ